MASTLTPSKPIKTADSGFENYNQETLDALQETLDIETGRIPAKRYTSVDGLFAENNAEIVSTDKS